MKKSSQSWRGVQDPGQLAVQQPEKVGWIRKFCGRGIFRELWRNRYVVLRGDHLYISDKEVKDERKAREVFDLADYERSEELRKAKSRSKKNHSRFTILHRHQPGNTIPNLVFLAVSPEEKESWVNVLNVAIAKAKNRVLDEVMVEDGALAHPTRDRAKIPHGRRLPTRGHLMAVASTSSHGMLTLDLVTEEDGFSPHYDGDAQVSSENSFRVDLWRTDLSGPMAGVGSLKVGGRQRAGTDVSKFRINSEELKVKTGSLPRHRFSLQVLQTQSRTPQPGKRLSIQGRSRCASMDEVLSSRSSHKDMVGGGASVQPVGQLQSLIAQRMQRAQELLEEMRLQRERGCGSPHLKSIDSPRLHHLRDSSHSRSVCPSANRSKGNDSPRSRGSQSPATKAKDSPRLMDSPGLTPSNSVCPPSTSSSGLNKVDSECVGRSDSSQVKGSESPADSDAGSPCPSQKDSQSFSGSFDSFQPKSPDKQALPPSLLSEEDLAVGRRRAEAERLLEEAVSSWKEAQEVLQEVKELQSQTLRRQRRRTYEKMTSPVSGAGLPRATAAADEDDTPVTPTSPEEDDESETP
uniref:Pleckstrin homology domain containing, family O member 1a n=1 Tax=Echeneis naucrates TaxID=173247 RepID=A0A665U178_ECHNA